ncbi:hypothetical protein KC332_g7076 [Hortaea werneckii]|nr:hypothetical protein KC350_g6296 [Hortaea werneckii]KAI6931437.1 hypothetical protein KC348_g7254 [Hortaea werneckii]KAI6936036.1 hypothetical protein KC341_g6493 [Hortaea werneckii]KAI6971031.1 hypothetical protein KC321_g6997 [Hortaea werneckii]KAI6985339.1 hypothetical protein KC329_g7021 [Hortaea werneckii]
MKPSSTLIMACMTTALCHATPCSVRSGLDDTVVSKRQGQGQMDGGSGGSVDGEGIAKGVLGIVGNALDIAKTAEPLLEGFLSGLGSDAPAGGEGSSGDSASAEGSGHGSGGLGALLNGLGGASGSGTDAGMSSTSTKPGLDKQQLTDIVTRIAAHLETGGKQNAPKEARDVELTQRQSGGDSGSTDGSGIAKGVLGIIESALSIAKAAGAHLPDISSA